MVRRRCRLVGLIAVSYTHLLSPLDVVAKFWGEIKKLVPATELHVVDPYLLDGGGLDPATYA